MKSCLYVGWVRHRRFAPTPHAFRYRVYMTYLDLAELDEAFRGRWLWSAQRMAPIRFRREDYLGDPAMPLDQAVRERVAQHTGAAPTGPIRMLTHLAHFGYCFNPVTFYYCFDASGTHVTHVLSEITNTPWSERHSYVLTATPDQRRIQARFGKTFHVSPFMPMALNYDWRFATPDEALSVHMGVHDEQRKLFDATLALQRRPITGANLARTAARFPLMPMRVVAGIYWQALRLWMKGVEFHPHPRTPATRTTPTTLSAIEKP